MRAHSLTQGMYDHVPSEDVAGYVDLGGSLVAWVVDGASTIGDEPFTTFGELSDAGWFARRIGVELAVCARGGDFGMPVLQDILERVRDAYRQQAGDLRQPAWAWPLVAATAMRIFPRREGSHIETITYAGCFLRFNCSGMPAITPTEVLAPSPGRPWKPCSGLKGAALRDMRDRRVLRQTVDARGTLTMDPRSALGGARCNHALPPGSDVLIGSDGLARLWCSYRLLSAREALALVARAGLPALFKRLRTHEASQTAVGEEVKVNDDASGIHIRI